MSVESQKIFGLSAEFDSPESILAAARRIAELGYENVEAYTPFPVSGLSEAVGFPRSRLTIGVFLGGLIGGLSGFFMQWFANVIHVTWNIGGRPLNSWPAFIPITFEMTILGAALTAVIGMLALNKLPQPYHPMFNLDEFTRASCDRFFLCIESDDPQFDLTRTRETLQSLSPLNIAEVPR